jgi:phage gp29-like protein
MNYQKTAAGLLVPADFADPAENGPALIGIEVASSEDGRDITRGYVNGLDLLTPEDPILQTKGAGNLKLYETLYSDPDVKIAFDQRQLGLVAKEWYVEPGAPDRKSKKAADLVKEALAQVAWDSATQKMQMGVFFGYAVAECLWVRDGTTIQLDAIKVKKARRFGFAPDGSLKLLTSAKPLGEPVPPRKFWQFACGAIDDDEPYGLGLGHWLYWPVWFRKNGEKFWSVYLEKFGMPTAVGKHPSGADKNEKAKLLQAVRAVHRDSGITISDNMMIELLEAKRASGGDYDKFIARWTSTIYRLIIGQDFSVTGAGGQYKGDNLMDVAGAIIKADADLINHSFTRSAAAWLTDWNYPGAAVPQVWRRCEDAPDLKSLSETQKNVFDMGYRPTLAQVAETYGGEWELVTAGGNPPDDNPNSLPPTSGGAAVELAEGDGPTPPDGPDRNVEQLSRRAEPLIDKLLAPMRALLDDGIREGWDLAEVQRRIPGLWDQMDAADLAELLAMGMFASSLGGRADVENEDG